jgi:membrane fusion protein, multidrug efflux system
MDSGSDDRERAESGRLADAGTPPSREGSGEPPRARRRLFVALAILACAGVAGAAGLTVRSHRREAAQRDALAREADAGPRVLVATAARASGERTITLPGDVRAFLQATLYAKVSGYVREMRVDKGDRVKRDQVVAVVESPETDQQVQAARSALEVRRRNADRARRLAPRGIISQQELDQALSDLRVAEADLRRVQALRGYEVVRAPFDGIVTTRYVDPGALTNASATGSPVVDVSDSARVRVLVNVGQDAAPFVRLGDAGEITLDQDPEARVPATVRRIADALDVRSRTMLVELWPDGEPSIRLVPGLFVHVALRVRIPPLPSVPAEALVSRGEKLQVALVRDRKLHFVDVEPGTNDGRMVQVRRGLQGGEVVALSPPSDLGEGAPVQPVAPEPRREEAGRGAQRSARTPAVR